MSAELNLIIRGTDQLSPVLSGVTGKLDTLSTTVSEKMGAIGQKMAVTGGVMTAGLTLPLVALGSKVVGLASDFEETNSKTGVIFEAMAGQVRAWAETSAQSMGMSKTAALEAVSTFGLMGQSAGLSAQAVVDFSQQQTQLAADLASFNNSTPEEALLALQAAYRGEGEPIRRFGVQLSDATIKLRAQALGLYEGTGLLSENAKMLAVQSLILEKTTKAQGDFARTSDGLANQQRILKAKLADTGAELGQKLLPLALKLVEKVSALVDWFSGLSDGTQGWIVKIGLLVAALGPAITFIGGLISAVGAVIGVIGGGAGLTAIVGGLGTALAVLTGPIGLVMGAVALLATAWTRDWGGIRTKTQEFVSVTWAKMKDFAGNVGEWAVGVGNWFKTIDWNDLGEKAVTGLKVAFPVFGLLSTAWEKDWGGIKTNTQGFVKDIVGHMTDFGKDIGEWAVKVGKWFGDIEWGEIGKNIIEGITKVLFDGPQKVYEALKKMFAGAFDRIKDFLGIHSPSALAAKELGLPIAMGVGAGIRQGMPAAMRNVTTNNYFSVSLVGGASAGQDVLNSVQLLSALYG